MGEFAVILPAAGQSSRFKGKEKKPFTNLHGRAIWLRSAEHFVARPDVVQCILVIAPSDEELVRRRYGANLAFMNIQLVHGGAERFESVANALAAINEQAEFVVIHDAVRPCVTEVLINAVFAKAKHTGAALLAAPVADTVKKVTKDHHIEETVSRENLWLAQTPQVFRKDWLLEAYAKRSELKQKLTDDCQLIEAAGHTVHVVPSDSSNLKVTTRTDLTIAEAVLEAHEKAKIPAAPIHPFAEDEMWGGK